MGDMFEKLAEWVKAGGEREDRYWSMGSRLGPFRCTLCWYGDGRLLWVERLSTTPEEAARLALDEFARTQGAK
jgi:hypothetical protein